MDINEVRDRLSLHLFFTEEGSTAEVMEEDLRALLSDHARLQAECGSSLLALEALLDAYDNEDSCRNAEHRVARSVINAAKAVQP